ncbi:MAG: LytTR family DNA-binding domain-containing protein [Oscillospiraceae bacterium]|nr:LytTR family DNA-binding domain-containing protein [Oscillospiraceae bacterium]
MLIYICDDQQEEASVLQLCLTKAAAELSVSCMTKVYCSGEALIDAVENEAAPSLVVLDVYMEGMSGIETGRRLRSLRPDLPLAFLTTSRDFAVDAFELNALHYIVKPVTVEAARALLERLPPRPGSTVKMLELPVQDGTAQFPLAEINRIISKSRGVEIHITGRSAAWLPCRFREVEVRLSDEPDFLLISRGCIVNLGHVQSIDFDTCCLKNGEQLPVSRRERLNVQNRYSDFLFRRLDRMKGGGL